MVAFHIPPDDMPVVAKRGRRSASLVGIAMLILAVASAMVAVADAAETIIIRELQKAFYRKKFN